MSGYNQTNHQAFSDPLSSEAKYWVGFLMGDGCIARQSGYWVVCLSQAEKDPVIAFKEFLQAKRANVGIVLPTGKTLAKVPIYQIHICSNQIGEDLIKLGVTPRKSHTAEVTKSLELDPDFWRGLIDADGCLCINSEKRIILGFGGSLQICNQFVNLVKFLTGKSPKIQKRVGLFQTQVSGKAAMVVTDFLYYPGHNISIKRKSEKALAFHQSL